MTIMEAIQQVDGLKPNAYSVRQKILWLSQLEAMDVTIRLEQLESILRLGPDGFWSVRFRVTVTQSAEALDGSLELQIRAGAVEAVGISCPDKPDRFYEINRCLYPSAHPAY